MKIGLITYHHSNNYGAVLQSYATCKALLALGHNVQFINIQQLEKKRLRHIVFIPKYLSFKRFTQKFYPQETPYIHNLQELRNMHLDYDCLVVGSDQVWNPNISLDKCLAYFLDFGGEKVKRISYASSFGLSDWPQEKKNLIAPVTIALKRFNNISVREKTGQELLTRLFGVNSKVVVDPTMLHNDYHEITGKIKENNEIICYLLNRTQEQLQASKFISKTLNTSPRLISNVYPIRGFKYVYPPSIEDWIRYIGGAKFVITDSFHGLVFSLLYRRNFIVFAVNNGRNSRLIDLLKLVGLEDRYFTDLNKLKSSIHTIKEIDYQRVETIIENNRKESWDFLKTSLTF